jgi:Fe-S-cluster containining protein
VGRRLHVVGAPSQLDCRSCGACCRNPLENQREGVHAWVEVADDEPLRRRARAAALLQRDADGRVHLKLVAPDDRCIALRGRIGANVRCSIYDVRPRGCRRVEAGDRRCLQYRAEAELSP